MTDSIRRAPAYFGYPNPFQFLERTAFLAASALCGTIAARIFIPSLNLKSHFVFGQVHILTFSLIFFNAKIYSKVKSHNNPLKKKLAYFTWAMAYTTIPTLFSKVVVSRSLAPLSISQSFTRGIYYAIFHVSSFCVYSLYQREQKKQGF